MITVAVPEPKQTASSQTSQPYARFARVYDLLLGDRFFHQLRRNFRRLAQRFGLRFNSAADVACGTGAFLRYLRQAGVPLVYGVDRSPEMLRLASRKNPGMGARLLRQDFASLRLPQAVDLITSNFDSLNYLLEPADLLRAFRRFHANLRPGGHTFFDMITGRAHWQEPGARVEDVPLPGGRFHRVTRWAQGEDVQRAIVTIDFNGRRYREIHTQRGYAPTTVIQYLRRANFIPLGVFDFHTLQSPASQTRRVLYLAKKQT